MNPDNAFGQHVRQRRRALDLTQDELARRVGCAAITLRKIEARRCASLAANRRTSGDGARHSARRTRRICAAGPRRAARRPRRRRPVLTPQVTSEEIGLEDLSGRAIRSYLLHDKIGAGAFGVVYRATQPLVEREVAVKIILPQYANHPDFIRRFESEAQLVARLEHPHIVPLYDYWRDPGVAYLVMRLLRGGNVQELIAARSAAAGHHHAHHRTDRRSVALRPSGGRGPSGFETLQRSCSTKRAMPIWPILASPKIWAIPPRKRRPAL